MQLLIRDIYNKKFILIAVDIFQLNWGFVDQVL